MRAGLTIAVTLLATAIAPGAGAGSVTIFGPSGSIEVAVDDLQSMRFREVVRQRYDFSCGSAVLATLMSFHYDRPTTETETFNGMYEVGDRERIQREGFSMLDMKRYLAGFGLEADGFHIPVAALEELGVPAIALIDISGYRHFVVVKGVRDGSVLVGDPAFGVKRYSIAAFEALRPNDILFLVRDHPDKARKTFNSEAAWAAVVEPPFDSAMARKSIAAFTLALPRPGDW